MKIGSKLGQMGQNLKNSGGKSGETGLSVAEMIKVKISGQTGCKYVKRGQ